MLGDFRLDDIGVRRRQRLGAEIDFDHSAVSLAAAGIGRRRQRLDGIADPFSGGRGEIEIEIETIDHTITAEGSQPFVDLLADGAEFHISGIAKRQHAELDAIEARRALAHQFIVGARGAGRRFAFAPGRRDEHQPLGGSQRRRIEIGHVDHARLQAVLARGLSQIVGKLFRIARFAGVDNVDRLGRARRRGRLRGAAVIGRIDAGEKSRQPGALDRRRHSHDAIEEIDLLFVERRSLWDRRHSGYSLSCQFGLNRGDAAGRQ